MGYFASPADVVQPHIAFAPGCSALQLQHLQRGFIRVEHLPLDEPPVQFLIYQFQGQSSATRSTQLLVVCRLNCTPARFHSCSCRYNGAYITNFCTMMWATASGEV